MTETCNCCGGDWPRDPESPTVRADAMCVGYLRMSSNGEVLGCGAWPATAYDDAYDDNEEPRS